MDIVVDENSRGKGIGKLLSDAAEKWVQEREANYLELSVLDENSAVRQLYIKEGFVTTS